MSAPPPHPRRELGAFTCLAIGLTTIVGSGIFALPPKLAASLGPLSFLAFLGAAAVVSLIGLMTAEAAGTTDRPGGAYQYVKMAFGAPAGFAVAWVSWANNVLSWATVSLALVKLLDVLRPGWGSGQHARAVATALLLGLGLLNARGARPGAAVANALTVAKLLPLFLFVVIGLLAFQPARFTGAGPALQAAGLSGFAAAVYRCIFAAGGFENVGVIAGEVKDPRRMIPRAVLLAIAGSSALYALVQIAAVSAVPELAQIAPKDAPGSLALPLAGSRAAAQLGGAALGALIYTVILVGALLSMIGYCAGAALINPRYLQAMAEDGFVPRALTLLSARGTPVFAIATATTIACAAVWAMDWLTLLDASVLFSLAQHCATTLAAWRLRRVVPTAGRFVAPFGPVFPVLALGSVLALCYFAFLPGAGADAIDLRHFGALALLLAVGAAVALATRRLSPPAAT